MNQSGRRWKSRRVAAFAVDAVILLAPAAAGGATVWLLNPLLRSIVFGGRLVLLVLLGSIVGLAVQFAVRRLMPLSALLRLTLAFPDQAPSRLAIARESSHPDVLLKRLESPDFDEATAAADILALVGALYTHDRRTRGHSDRVRAYADLLGKEIGLPEQDRDRLQWAALLHDIGKLRVDSRIINKPCELDACEWAEMKQHPMLGAELAAPLMHWLGEWGKGIEQHHERFDGSGYPLALAGNEISRAARIISVVDAYDVMTSARSYKKPTSHRAARKELARCAGTQFDPDVVRAFLAISLPRLLWAVGPLGALLQAPVITFIEYAGTQALAIGGTAAALTPALALGSTVAGPTLGPADQLIRPFNTVAQAAAHPTAGPHGALGTATSTKRHRHGHAASGPTGPTSPTGPTPPGTPTPSAPTLPVPVPSLPVPVPSVPLPKLPTLPLPKLPTLPTLPALPLPKVSLPATLPAVPLPEVSLPAVKLPKL